MGEGVGSGREVFVAAAAVLLGVAVVGCAVSVGWSVGGGVVFITVLVGVISTVLVEAAAGEHAADKVSKIRLSKVL